MDVDAVEAVGDRRAARAAGLVLGAEHEVVDEQLRAPVEQVRQRLAPVVGVEAVLLVDADPRQLPPPARELVAAARVLLLGGEQLAARGQPLLSGPDRVLGHRVSSRVAVGGRPLASSAIRLIAASRVSHSAATCAIERVATTSRSGRTA